MKKEICNGLIVIIALAGIYCLCMSLWTEFLSSIIWIVIIYLIKSWKPKKNSTSPLTSQIVEPIKNEYLRKNIMTANEFAFFKKIQELETKYIIIPQVNLAAIIDKTGSKYHNELFKNIDFGIFSKEYELLLLIELNDASHNQIKRRDRDLKVKKILNECNIPMLTFYTFYPNEKNYVLNRIIKCLDNLDDAKNKNN